MASSPTYTIGQTARLCGISVQTLRFYDRIGLVKPAEVDDTTGYRYYSHRDLMQIKIVQDLRGMAFSLEEIRSLLTRGGAEAVLQSLRAKREETVREIRRLEELAASMEKRIGQLEDRNGLRQTVENGRYWLELKWLPDRRAACIRKRSACGMEPYVVRFSELFQEMGKQGLKPDGCLFAMYHEPMLTFDRGDSDIEVGVPVQAPEGSSPLIRSIPGGEFLISCYTGAEEGECCREIYTLMTDWAERNGYELAGPVMEEYLVDMANLGSPDEFIIELQVPVNKLLTL